VNRSQIPSPPALTGSSDPLPALTRRVDIEQVRHVLPELIDSLADPVVVVDRDRRVIAANRRYLEAFGARQDSIAGIACRDALRCPETESAGGAEPCAACVAFERSTPQRALRTVSDAQGNPRRYDVTFNPVADGAGLARYVVEVWRDITEREQMRGHISRSERLASLGILAAGVAHEINNPMASVLAGLESLQHWLERISLEESVLEEAREVLEVLERESRRCRETTDKLMLLAQPVSEAARWVDLNLAARDTLSLLTFLARKQGVKVVDDLAADLPRVWARESGMRAVWMNLAMNSVQAMTGGGTLTVGTRREGEAVRLWVSDTGPGIAPEHLERIWDPFFTTKPVGQGTGLGLSITQGIVRRHGGVIRARNRPESGMHFEVELPITGPGGDGV
jgi:PAS domain S-box-containing protein